MKEKVIVAMSGGVDSSVAALLLYRAGYEVLGVTMRLYNLEDDEARGRYQGCCTLDDVEDARIVCHRIGVPHYVFNVQEEFKAFVIDYFVREYQQGRTPHPCIACNERIKFSFLLNRARFLGAQYVATGHYARITTDSQGFHLLKAMDTAKDQSYVLYGMGQEELANTLLPVGWYTKNEIRRMAREANFPNADKPDSQDICFIPSGDYRQWLARHTAPRPGNIVDTKGNVLGEHRGIEFFTVGQRKGLVLQTSSPMYVVGIDAGKAQVIVGTEEELYRPALTAEHVRWVVAEPSGPIEVTVKVRYKSPKAPAVLYPQGDKALLRFAEPQRAVTPGQAVVFYRGDEVLGGGRIEHSITAEEMENSDTMPARV